jgi:hypothetical protein
MAPPISSAAPAAEAPSTFSLPVCARVGGFSEGETGTIVSRKVRGGVAGVVGVVPGGVTGGTVGGVTGGTVGGVTGGMVGGTVGGVTGGVTGGTVGGVTGGMVGGVTGGMVGGVTGGTVGGVTGGVTGGTVGGVTGGVTGGTVGGVTGGVTGGTVGGVTGGTVGGVTGGVLTVPPVSFPHLLPNAGFSRATTSTVLPHAFTGTSTGAWTRLPDRTPGEPWVLPDAVAPEVRPCEPEPLMQEFPKVGLSAPITLTVLPQAFTGTCTGT